MRIISVLFSFFILTQHSFAQDIVDQIMSTGTSFNSEIFTETIKIISRSKKIFITTNENGQLGKGDFITLIINDTEPVARALVAKNHDGLTGIKILKIYSLKRWSKLHQDGDVQILKGDDSKLFIKKVEASPEIKEIEEQVISGEEDLYNDVAVIDGDVGLVNKDNRHIKPDNIVGFSWGKYAIKTELNNEENVISSNQWYGHWAYQFADNFWIEGVFGRTLVSNFPATSTSTLIMNWTARLKYTFKAPLYSYIMPYIGYQNYTVDSPDAGRTEDENLANEELLAIENLKKRNVVFGATVLRRLVPGWFLKADLGTDGLNIGFAVEF